jgi:hypothetical protein
MKRFLIFLLFPCFIWSQELTFIEKNELDADVFIGVDNYNSLYFIKDQVLYKKGTQTTYNFNDLQQGEIQSVDIINPLNILVFYSDSNTVVFLDNYLNEIERINFSALSKFINVSHVSMAGKNQLWVFNIDSQQLELYNYRSQRKIVVSQPFEGDIISQTSNFNYCYLLTKHQLRSYNIYGSLISEYTLKDYKKVVQHNNDIIIVKENELYYMPEDSLLAKKIVETDFNIKDLQLKQDFLYIYDGNQVHTFSLKLPKE